MLKVLSRSVMYLYAGNAIACIVSLNGKEDAKFFTKYANLCANGQIHGGLVRLARKKGEKRNRCRSRLFKFSMYEYEYCNLGFLFAEANFHVVLKRDINLIR